ncbi:hypothetical protein AB4305_28955 [Nocardia sp. 2YAB30]|uniref:hypothetical protein n=1 Tax=Nocardia sp. 2YAB30 TaxID=3233022 RepID=UPI003F9B068D
MNEIDAHRTVVDWVTLRVPAGQVHALLGPDGSRISIAATAFLAIPGIFDVIAHGQTETSTSSGSDIEVLDWMNVRDAEGVPAENYMFVRDDGNILPLGQDEGRARGDEWEVLVRAHGQAAGDSEYRSPFRMDSGKGEIVSAPENMKNLSGQSMFIYMDVTDPSSGSGGAIRKARPA